MQLIVGASVISAVLATLLAVHFGFGVVIALALSLYIASVATFPVHTKNLSSGK